MKTEDWGCYLPVIDASCNSHCPHTLQADGEKERKRERQRTAALEGWVDGKKKGNSGEIMPAIDGLSP